MNLDTIDPADTGSRIARPVGEDTRYLGVHDLPMSEKPRRPFATGAYPTITPATEPAATGGEGGSARRSVPYALPEGWTWDGPRHRRPSALRRWFGGAR